MEMKARSRMYHLACHLQEGSSSAQASGIATRECSSFVGLRKDNRVIFARQGADSCGRFMRPIDETPEEKEPERPKLRDVVPGKHPEELKFTIASRPTDEAPLFARRSVDEFIYMKTSTKVSESQTGTACSSLISALEIKPDLHSGAEWAPRMDVMDSGAEHVLTIELPGVNVDNIRVEIEKGRLLVTGVRRREWWANPDSVLVHNIGSEEGKVYYRRDLPYGPYRATWALPNNANYSAASAEFIDGFLRVVIPKIRTS